MRSLGSFLLVLLTALASLDAGPIREDKKSTKKSTKTSSRDLTKESRFSLSMKKPQPVSRLLAYIEEKSGNTIRIVDKFGRDDRQTLGEKVAFRLRKKTFWEVVEAIEKKTGARFWKVEGGALWLSKEKPFGARTNRKPAGRTVSQGAILVVPQLDTFFGRLVVALRPEPRLSSLELRSGRVVLTGEGDERREIEAHDLFSGTFMHTGELELHFDLKEPGSRKKKSPAMRVARKVEVTADLRALFDLERKILPSIGKLLGKLQKRGKTAVRVIEASRVSEGTREAVHVRLRVSGGPIAATEVVLRDAKGNRVKTAHANGFFDDDTKTGSYDLTFPALDFQGKLEDAGLVLPTGGKPLSLSSRAVCRSEKLGAVAVRVVKADFRTTDGEKQFVLEVEVTGGSVDVRSLQLLDHRGREVKASGWSSTGSRVRHLSRFYEASELKRNPMDYRLALVVPTRTQDFTLKAELEDINLEAKK
ncbi:MAG: hypothetical protein O7J95_03645 [Planctomycetota bacterium]|nr:hypothetical protein [Planctomycetota bacterium]